MTVCSLTATCLFIVGLCFSRAHGNVMGNPWCGGWTVCSFVSLCGEALASGLTFDFNSCRQV